MKDQSEGKQDENTVEKSSLFGLQVDSWEQM